MNICIGIRVFSRVDDLKEVIDIINTTWKANNYDIYVISNGESSGFKLPDSIHKEVYKVVSLNNNTGHQKGSSQLLQAFYDNICFENNYDYSIILEADTWIYGDDIIDKYISIMKVKKAVYAGAQWYDNYCSLATDFAIIDNTFLKQNRDLFVFDDYAECHMANYLLERNIQYVYIRENTYPNLPGYLTSFRYPYTNKGRFNCFPYSKTVTHHIEDLNGGIEEKKRLFNIVSQADYYNIKGSNNSFVELFLMKLFFNISRLLFRKSWYSRNNILNDC